MAATKKKPTSKRTKSCSPGPGDLRIIITYNPCDGPLPEQYSESFTLLDTGKHNARKFQPGNQGHVTWQSDGPFGIIFQSRDWRKYLKPHRHSSVYLYAKRRKPMALISTPHGPSNHSLTLCVRKKHKKRELDYVIIADLVGKPKLKKKKRSGRGHTHAGSALARASINLQS